MVSSFTDVPEPVDIIKAEAEDYKITIHWEKPTENGAAITRYFIYRRIKSDERWTKVAVVEDASRREYNIQVENGGKYEFVVTATNKYGESGKENVRTVEVHDGGKYTCLHSCLA